MGREAPWVMIGRLFFSRFPRCVGFGFVGGSFVQFRRKKNRLLGVRVNGVAARSAGAILAIVLYSIARAIDRSGAVRNPFYFDELYAS